MRVSAVLVVSICFCSPAMARLDSSLLTSIASSIDCRPRELGEREEMAINDALRTGTVCTEGQQTGQNMLSNSQFLFVPAGCTDEWSIWDGKIRISGDFLDPSAIENDSSGDRLRDLRDTVLHEVGHAKYAAEKGFVAAYLAGLSAEGYSRDDANNHAWMYENSCTNDVNHTMKKQLDVEEKVYFESYSGGGGGGDAYTPGVCYTVEITHGYDWYVDGYFIARVETGTTTTQVCSGGGGTYAE